MVCTGRIVWTPCTCGTAVHAQSLLSPLSPPSLPLNWQIQLYAHPLKPACYARAQHTCARTHTHSHLTHARTHTHAHTYTKNIHTHSSLPASPLYFPPLLLLKGEASLKSTFHMHLKIQTHHT